MGPWESVTANQPKRGGRAGRKGESLRGQCWTTSADDGHRTGEAQPLARKSDPIWLARAAIRPLILGQKAVEKRRFQRVFGRKSDTKVTQKCATCRIGPGRPFSATSGSLRKGSEPVTRAADPGGTFESRSVMTVSAFETFLAASLQQSNKPRGLSIRRDHVWHVHRGYQCLLIIWQEKLVVARVVSQIVPK